MDGQTDGHRTHQSNKVGWLHATRLIKVIDSCVHFIGCMSMLKAYMQNLKSFYSGSEEDVGIDDDSKSTEEDDYDDEEDLPDDDGDLIDDDDITEEDEDVDMTSTNAIISTTPYFTTAGVKVHLRKSYLQFQ